MKKFYFLFLLFMFHYGLGAQSCLPDGITFTTQGQIDSFPINYPGCTEVSGFLIIGINNTPTTSITNLDSLSVLTAITGGLHILYNNALTDLDGLSGITFIGEACSIKKNNLLVDVNGLNGVTSVGGALQISYNDELTDLSGLNGITSIGGDFSIKTLPSLYSLDGLNGFTASIAGILSITFCDGLSNLDGLSGITSVGGIDLIANDGLVDINGLSGITSFAGDLNISSVEALTNLDGLNGITTIGGDVYIQHNDELANINGLSGLTSVGERLHINNNYTLADISGLSALTSIGISLYINNNDALPSLNGLGSLTSLGGYLHLNQNDILTNIDGLSGLSSIGGYLEIQFNHILNNLTGLDGVTSIGGNLRIRKNSTLTSLTGLGGVTSIAGDLHIEHNTVLTDLNGLKGLTSIGANLSIFNNPLLTDIRRLHSVSAIGGNLEIYDNPLLDYCAINPICLHITVGGTTDIHNNATGCNNADEVLNFCNFGTSGRTYFDYNQNQQQDTLEPGISAMAILYEPQNDIIFSNNNGWHYNFSESDSVFTISLIDNPDWVLTTDSASYTILFEPGNAINNSNDFGLYPTFSNHDFSVNVSSNQTRCNTNVNYFLNMRNEGTFIENGTITISYDELIEFVSAIPEPLIVDSLNHTLTWNYDALYPFAEQDYMITFTMPGVDNIADIVAVSATIYRDSLDSPVETAQMEYRSEIVCSYDPNDKQVNPPGEQDANYTLKEDPLQYTVRFQNTGNTYAIDVTLRDTLDTNLALSTFRVLQSSHSVQASINPEGAVSFYFKDIFLPDSTTSYEASQGFVVYEIEPIPGLDDYTVITNTASIYFDYNPAIVTNTTMNTLVDEIPVAVKEIGGAIRTESDIDINNVFVDLIGEDNSTTLLANGNYLFEDIPTESEYTVRPSKNDDPLNGITSFDLVLIRKHILNVTPLDSPYKIIAADINKSGNVSTLDLLELRKLILHINDNFPENDSWRFIDADYVFPEPTNPFSALFPEEIFITDFLEDRNNVDFIGVKIGDVNESATPGLNDIDEY